MTHIITSVRQTNLWALSKFIRNNKNTVRSINNLSYNLNFFSLHNRSLVTPSFPIRTMATIAASFSSSTDNYSQRIPSLNWSLTSTEVNDRCTKLIQQANATLDSIATATNPDWTSVLGPLAALDRNLETETCVLTFLKDVSTDEQVRSASAVAQSALSAWEVSAGMREDVYKAVKLAIEKLGINTEAGIITAEQAKAANLDHEATRFVERTLRDYRRKGLHLPDTIRKELTGIRTVISDLCIQFQQTLGEWKVTLAFTKEELAGMPDDWISSLDKEKVNDVETGKYVVTLSYPHVVPILKTCTVPSTRAAVEKAFNSRGHPQNTEVLSQIVRLRRYAAKLLGYPSHASYVLEERMAGNPEKVETFLKTLQKDLLPLHKSDLATLNNLKSTEEPNQGTVNMADYRYYQEKDLSMKYNIDHEMIKKYFPLQYTLDAMLKIYETILSLKFVLLPAGSVPTWHPDVQVYAVIDNSQELRSQVNNDLSSIIGPNGWITHNPGELCGYFYLDLHPRPGKYTHAAVFPLLSGCAAGDLPTNTNNNGDRTLPLCAMVCNFPKPTSTAPSLMRHEEVETLFHEFGHVMHHICSRTRFHRFASFRCENDFVEAPSQMLEEWVWSIDTLQLLSNHYQTNEKLPEELCKKLEISRSVHSGLFNTRQIFLALLDYTIHTLPALDLPSNLSFASLVNTNDTSTATSSSTTEGKPLDNVLKQLPPITDDENIEKQLVHLHNTVLLIPWTEGTNFAASFGHLVGGYDAQYYGYLWSEVYANDMAESVFRTSKKGLLDPISGYRYRSCILAPGGARDAADSLKGFLGREPSNAAFLKLKGIGK